MNTANLPPRSKSGRAIDNSGGGSDDGDMNARISRIEAILPTLATKADIVDAKGSLSVLMEGVRGDVKGWMLATTLTIIATVVATIVALNTLFKSPASLPVQPAAPVIIQVPAYPAPAATPSSHH